MPADAEYDVVVVGVEPHAVEHAVIGSVCLSRQFRNAVANINGASEVDIPAAQKILDSGEAGTPEAAVSLAVFRRQTELAKRPKPTPSETAKRKAGAVAASRQAGSSYRGGHPKQRIPQGEHDYAEMLKNMPQG